MKHARTRRFARIDRVRVPFYIPDHLPAVMSVPAPRSTPTRAPRGVARVSRRLWRTAHAGWVLAAVAVVPAALPTAAAAQTVLGRVVDSATHRPVAGLTVRLVAEGDSARDSVVARAQTAPDGAFVLEAPRPGTYRVRLTAAHLGPPLTLAAPDAEDQHQYVIGPVPPPPAALPTAALAYHVLRGAELDSALGANAPLLACQVETTAALVPGTVAMQFPRDLRGRTRSAGLLATFVVDTLGHLDASTLQIRQGPGADAAYATSVAQGLRRARFRAAVAGGRRVRQQMYVPVTFRLSTEPGPPLLQGDPCGPISSDDAVLVTGAAVGAGPPWPP